MRPLRAALNGAHPEEVWFLALGGAISAVGSSMVLPLFTLFLTSRYGIGLATAGGLAALFFAGGMVGQTYGGHLADVVGRRPVILGAVFGSALTSLAVGFAPSLELIVPATAMFGLFTASIQPAGGAVVADLVPPAQRVRSFALLRVFWNIGYAIGPALAGVFLALGRDPTGHLEDTAYQPLFLIDACTSVVFGTLVAWRIRETRPSLTPSRDPSSTRSGYRIVLGDGRFLGFAGAWVLVTIVYIQLFTTVGPYLARTHGFMPERFAALLSVNAGLVVLTQLFVTRFGQRIGLQRALQAGALAMGLGLFFIGFGGSVPSVVAAIVIFTIGEMLLAPNGEAVAASFADPTNRGRYLGIFAVASGTGRGLGPFLGGLVIDVGLGPALWPSVLVLSIGTGVALGGVIATRAPTREGLAEA